MFEIEIENSLTYLKSDQAMRSLDADAYWPKWHSPWWHMLLLHEMGETSKIPEPAIKRFISALHQIRLKKFPIHQEEWPKDLDPYRGSPCHCQLGNVYQVLAKFGIDVDQELPWIRLWILKYQMSDGGFNCDHKAYLVTDEVPSSMVGTIAAFEAILLYTKGPWTKNEEAFLNQAAHFLLARKLIHGSQTKFNAEERDSAKDWLLPCFPRFYLYDVLRGLHALALWSEKTGKLIPQEAVKEAVTHLKNRFPDGKIRILSQAYEGIGTISQVENGEWLRGQTATLFPLLVKVSELGTESPYLTAQWAKVQALL